MELPNKQNWLTWAVTAFLFSAVIPMGGWLVQTTMANSDQIISLQTEQKILEHEWEGRLDRIERKLDALLEK